MTHNKLKIALAGVLATAAATADAQIRPTYQYPGGAAPTGVQMGEAPIYFTPFVGFAVGRDDNVLLSPTNEKASTLYVFSPGFRLEARAASAVLQVEYQGQLGRYTQSEDDNYLDHTARAQMDFAFSERAFLRLGSDYVRAHEQRGSSDRGIMAEPDKYRRITPNATFAYGAMGAPGRVEIYYSDARRDYLNNRETTQFFDNHITEYGGAFFVRIAPKTYAVAEARNTNISYEILSPFRGQERRYFGGVSWEATAATTGTVKVGRMTRRFDSALPEVTETVWEGIVSWAPRSYSSFEFYTTRTTNEVTGSMGNFIVSAIAGVNWNHSWSSALRTMVFARHQKDEYQGFDRTDKVNNLGVKVGYRFRRWLTLGAEYTHTRRDSNDDFFEYNRNLYLLTATASM